jgi:O-antigen ligase
MSHFVVFPCFALLLVGELGWFAVMTPIAGMITAILTTSRATVAVAGFGYALIFMISALRGWTPRKAKIAAAGVIVVIVILPLFVSSFGDRFGSDIGSAFFGIDESRDQMSQAASMMLSDHPMGVGANNFVMAAATKGYYSRAGLSWIGWGSTVHNVYWLVAAETGYVGLVAFVILLLRPLTVAFLCGWRNRGDKRGDLLLGFGVALLMVYVHSFYEWVFVTFGVQYIFAATAGLIAGLAQQLGYWRRANTIASRSSYFARPAAEAAQHVRIKSHR